MMTEREIFLEALEMSWEEIAAAEPKEKTEIKQP